tara:strand:- start:18 stop:656 length:639 start_codon:yes stop_codon:yes gene_type:complete
MKKLLLLLLCVPLIGFSQWQLPAKFTAQADPVNIMPISFTTDSTAISQSIDTTHLYVARDLGYCINKLKPLHLKSSFYHPQCYTDVRVFHIKPDYFGIYINSAGHCGSCGCHLTIVKKKNDILVEVGMVSCIDVDMNQPLSNDFILINDGFMTSLCHISYRAKYSINDKSLKLLEVTKYEHRYHSSKKSEYDTHKNDCEYKNSSWMSDRDFD